MEEKNVPKDSKNENNQGSSEKEPIKTTGATAVNVFKTVSNTLNSYLLWGLVVRIAIGVFGTYNYLDIKLLKVLNLIYHCLKKKLMFHPHLCGLKKNIMM